MSTYAHESALSHTNTQAPHEHVDEFQLIDPATKRIVEQWSRRPKRTTNRGTTKRTNTITQEKEAYQAAAFQRYLRDQAMLEEVKVTRRMLRYKGRPDVRWIYKWAGRLIKTYDMVTAFIGAHLGGPVSRATRDRRAAY